MPVLQMTQLGRMGRAGNSFVQYAFLKIYSRRHGLAVQVPPWIGETLFGFRDAPPGRILPAFHENVHTPRGKEIIPNLKQPLRDVDVHGYFQYETSYYAPDREYIQNLFARPAQAMVDRMSPAIDRLRHGAQQVIGVHVRRGDYGQRKTIFYLTPIDWYVEALDRLVTPSTTVFVSSDDPTVVRSFAKYNPVTAPDLGINLSKDPLPGICHLAKDVRDGNATALDFFPDWELLRHCDTMLIPNSTFSFTAAWLSTCAQSVWRSNPDTRRFEAIDPWDSPMAQFFDPSQYQHVPGMWMEKNLYW